MDARPPLPSTHLLRADLKIPAAKLTLRQAHCLITVREIRGNTIAAGLQLNQLVNGGERGHNIFLLPFQPFTQF